MSAYPFLERRTVAEVDAGNHPVIRLIDDLLSFETPNARWLRDSGPAISRAYAEMMAERKQGETE